MLGMIKAAREDMELKTAIVRGRCWHEYEDDPSTTLQTFFRCKKCGAVLHIQTTE